MAVLTQTYPGPVTGRSIDYSELTKSWNNRLAYWQKESDFLMSIIEVHYPVDGVSANFKKAHLQFSSLISKEFPKIKRALNHISREVHAPSEPSRKSLPLKKENFDALKQRLVRIEQKFNLLKLVLLEKIAADYPVQLY